MSVADDKYDDQIDMVDESAMWVKLISQLCILLY